jgi:Spy/CpxP family protein refolding chaperone
MMTIKASVVLILAYILALAAGTTSGLLAGRLRGHSGAAPSTPLAEQLQLTPDQSEQIRYVWETVSQTVDSCFQQAQAIQQQRDQALYNELTDDQKARFAIIDQGYAKQFAALMAQRQQAFRDGLARTEAMLDDSQRVKYEQIVRQRLGDISSSPGTTQPSLEDVRP